MIDEDERTFATIAEWAEAWSHVEFGIAGFFDVIEAALDEETDGAQRVVDNAMFRDLRLVLESVIAASAES